MGELELMVAAGVPQFCTFTVTVRLSTVHMPLLARTQNVDVTETGVVSRVPVCPDSGWEVSPLPPRYH